MIGIIGEIAAGKDTAAAVFSERLGMPVFELSKILKDIATERDLPNTRPTQIEISEELAEKFGSQILAELFCKQLRTPTIVTGMRQVGQLKYLRENTNFFLIAISATPEIRYERSQKRAKHSDVISYEEFIQIRKRDTGSKLQNFTDCLAMADIVIENNNSYEEFIRNLQAITIPHD